MLVIALTATLATALGLFVLFRRRLRSVASSRIIPGCDRGRAGAAAVAGDLARGWAGGAHQPLLGVCRVGSPCAFLGWTGATARRRRTLGYYGDRRARVGDDQQPSSCCPSLGTPSRAPERTALGVKRRPQHCRDWVPFGVPVVACCATGTCTAITRGVLAPRSSACRIRDPCRPGGNGHPADHPVTADRGQPGHQRNSTVVPLHRERPV